MVCFFSLAFVINALLNSMDVVSIKKQKQTKPNNRSEWIPSWNVMIGHMDKTWIKVHVPV